MADEKLLVVAFFLVQVGTPIHITKDFLLVSLQISFLNLMCRFIGTQWDKAYRTNDSPIFVSTLYASYLKLMCSLIKSHWEKEYHTRSSPSPYSISLYIPPYRLSSFPSFLGKVERVSKASEVDQIKLSKWCWLDDIEYCSSKSSRTDILVWTEANVCSPPKKVCMFRGIGKKVWTL